jgi:hypothetical protein
MFTKFENDLPGHSRIWVYQSSRKFDSAETNLVHTLVQRFVTDWTSHKVGVTGDGALLHNRFIILMADESKVGVSGCSIDSSVRFIKTLGEQLDINFFDRWNIAYIKNNEVHSCCREEFEKLVDEKTITDDTLVFNNLVRTKNEFETNWQIPYGQSWLKNLKASHISFNSVL